MLKVEPVSWSYLLRQSIENDDTYELKKFLDIGVSPFYTVETVDIRTDKVSIITACLINKSMQCFEYLLNSGVDPSINHGDRNPITELLFAAAKNKYTLREVKSLVPRLVGCRMTPKEIHEMFYIFFWKYERESFDLIDYIFTQFNVDIDHQDSKGYTLLTKLLTGKPDRQLLNFAEYLISGGASLDTPNKFGQTPRFFLNQKSKSGMKQEIERNLGIVI